MEEEKTITPREQLLVITTAIIMAGMAANYSTVSLSFTHSIIAKGLARDLLNSILNQEKLSK